MNATHADAQDLTVEAVEAAICNREPEHYIDHHDWAQDCDGVSRAIVRSGILPGARVARGRHTYLSEDHSWVFLADGSTLDATMWSYVFPHPVLYVTETGKGYTKHKDD